MKAHLFTFIFLLPTIILAQTNPSIYIEQGADYYKQQNYFKASESYSRALKLNAPLRKCDADEIYRSYAHIEKYDSALIYWEKVYRSNQFFPKMDIRNIEWFEHSAKDSLWDPVRETDEWKETYDRIYESYKPTLVEINWEYRNQLDSLYDVNNAFNKERVKVMNKYGFNSKEMKAFNKKVEIHQEYSVEVVEDMLDHIDFPTKEVIGMDGYKYLMQVIGFADQDFLNAYWTKIEEAYFLEKIHASHYERWKERRLKTKD